MWLNLPSYIFIYPVNFLILSLNTPYPYKLGKDSLQMDKELSCEDPIGIKNTQPRWEYCFNINISGYLCILNNKPTMIPLIMCKCCELIIYLNNFDIDFLSYEHFEYVKFESQG